MKKRHLAIVAAFSLSALAVAYANAEEGITRFTLDNFSTSKVGGFPVKWRTWPFQSGKAKKIYCVGEEIAGGDDRAAKRRFIKARDPDGMSQQIFLNFNWPIQSRPKLSWEWRATEIPAGANESNDGYNDSACGVYVVVGKYSGHAIKYAWSTSLAPGTVVTRRDGRLKIKILDSGAGKIGQWVHHTVDVPADYKALFGKDIDRDPTGIGILTDGNAVHKPAGCDYTGFVVSK